MKKKMKRKKKRMSIKRNEKKDKEFN